MQRCHVFSRTSHRCWASTLLPTPPFDRDAHFAQVLLPGGPHLWLPWPTRIFSAFRLDFAACVMCGAFELGPTHITLSKPDDHLLRYTPKGTSLSTPPFARRDVACGLIYLEVVRRRPDRGRRRYRSIPPGFERCGDDVWYALFTLYGRPSLVPHRPVVPQTSSVPRPLAPSRQI